MKQIVQQILEIKKNKNAIILAHNYQIQEVQDIADFIGDSLELSRIAAKNDSQIIVFAGVKFMAETAKVLSPQKKVLLPRLDAGCPMADMITVDELIKLRMAHPNAKVVTYVNSSVEIKAESDVCCTSSNAVDLIKGIKEKEIVFIPDQNLGNYIQKNVPDKKIITFKGYCYVHDRLTETDVLETIKKYPGALVIAHPEVKLEISELADQVLSTSGMLKFVKHSKANSFIVFTEEGLLNRLRSENLNKKIYSSVHPLICSNMKKTTIDDIYSSLLDEKFEITIEPTLTKKASRSLRAMIDKK